MKLNVLENKANKLSIELEGLGHTFCNALKEELRTDKTVVVAAYNINHPLQGKPTFFIETKGSTPKAALETAINGLKKKNADFLKAFNAMK